MSKYIYYDKKYIYSSFTGTNSQIIKLPEEFEDLSPLLKYDCILTDIGNYHTWSMKISGAGIISQVRNNVMTLMSDDEVAKILLIGDRYD